MSQGNKQVSKDRGKLGSPRSLGALRCGAGRGVDLLGVQKVSAPTRDVLVTRDMSGERTFAGFGAAANEEYADAMIEADKLPLGAIKVGCRSGWPSWSMCSTAGLLQSCSRHCRPGFPRQLGGCLGKQGLLTCTTTIVQQSLHTAPLKVL